MSLVAEIPGQAWGIEGPLFPIDDPVGRRKRAPGRRHATWARRPSFPGLSLLPDSITSKFSSGPKRFYIVLRCALLSDRSLSPRGLVVNSLW